MTDDAVRSWLAGCAAVTPFLKKAFGPGGRHLKIEKSFGAPVRTRKGATLVDEARPVLSDAGESLGLATLVEVAEAVHRSQGDGTTSAALLVEALFEAVAGGASGDALRAAAAEVSVACEARAAPIAGHLEAFLESQACGVASTRALYEAIRDGVSPDAVAVIPVDGDDEPHLVLSTGRVLTGALASPAFGDSAREPVVIETPVLFHLGDGTAPGDVVELLRAAADRAGPRVFLSARFSPEVLAVLVSARYVEGLSFAGVSVDDMPEDGQLLHQALGGDVPRVYALEVEPAGFAECERITVTRQRVRVEGTPYPQRLATLEVGRGHLAREPLQDVVSSLESAAHTGVIPGGGRALAEAGAALSAPHVGRALGRLREILGEQGTPYDATGVVLGALQHATRRVADLVTRSARREEPPL